jgi:protein-S-isoprenylcysteine O-methyltransferase Ste14
MSIIPWIIAGCWVAFIGYWIISSIGVKRDISVSPWTRLWWVRIAIASVIIGLFWDRSPGGKLTREMFATNPYLGLGIFAPIGAVLAVAGTALAIWARMHLGRNWSSRPALKEGHELVTSGPYRIIRHPIYTGVILATLGSTIVSPTWLVMFFIITALFIWRVHTEERLMMQQFPDQYPAYKKNTWALVPYLW